jgi:primosomal protein N' (replication factor Y)
MRQSLDVQRQVILFLNRRGFGYFYHCRSCGSDFTCTRCSVSLTYHRHNNMLVCHHCGYLQPAPRVCPECGSLDLGFSGFGTEKVEEDVRQTFPSARIARLDTDSTRKKGVLAETIDDFRNGNIDILLGTQMVAKGLNFPGVNLVGIIMADSSLHLPDFRSYEKTFALITQVAGRAGRYSRDGRVILQTLNSSHHIIRQAAASDIEGFYRQEIRTRRELKFPPFSRIIRLLVRGRQEEQVFAAATALRQEIERFLSDTSSRAEILGPAESPISMLNHNYRVHMLILSSRISELQAGLPRVLENMKFPSSLYVEVDVDPQSLL